MVQLAIFFVLVNEFSKLHESYKNVWKKLLPSFGCTQEKKSYILLKVPADTTCTSALP